MSKFKVGDEVICTSRYDENGTHENYLDWFTIGRRYTVVAQIGALTYVRDDDGDQMAIPDHAFELAATFCSHGTPGAVPEDDKALAWIKEALVASDDDNGGPEDDYQIGWTAGYEAALKQVLREVYGIQAVVQAKMVRTVEFVAA